MKPTAIIIALLICLCVKGQNPVYRTLLPKPDTLTLVRNSLVVYGDSLSIGKPCAVRRPSGMWKIDCAEMALEAMYLEYIKLNDKYQAAIAILKLLSPQGCPTDNKKYISAVSAYNNLLSK